jgi:hypothetical protein
MPLTDYAAARAAGRVRRLPALSGPSTPQGAGYGADVYQWARGVVEKVRVAAQGGRLRFLPWYDPYTDETPEIRREYPKMLVEPTVKAAFQTKILSVVSLPVQFNPPDDDDPRQQEAADFCRWTFKHLEGGTPAAGWDILSGAVVKGHSLCEKVWPVDPLPSGRFRGKRPIVAIKAKDTDFLQPLVDAYRNVEAIRGYGFNAGRTWPVDTFVRFSYLDLYRNPGGMSDFRAAYRAYWQKHTAWQLWGLNLGSNTGPFIVGRYGDVSQKAALDAALEEARGHTWLSIPMNAAVEVIHLAAGEQAAFDAMIDKADKEMLIAIVGADVLVPPKPGGQGPQPEPPGGGSVAV